MIHPGTANRTETTMNNLARIIDFQPQSGVIRHEAATVTEAASGGFKVRAPSGDFSARKAASCLLAPRPGDLVDLSLVEGGDCWIVAVLERDEASAAEIAVPGDLDLRAGGRVRVGAQQGIDLCAEESVSVVTGRVEVRSVEVRATFERLSALGKLVHQQIEKVRSVSSTVDVVAERMSQTFERCYRFVGESDTLRARRVDVQAEETLRIHGNNAVVTAEGLVKLDGGQIHMG